MIEYLVRGGDLFGNHYVGGSKIPRIPFSMLVSYSVLEGGHHQWGSVASAI